jgi:mRNA interferase RelE/StbE
MRRRVTVQWTSPAKAKLATLPPKIRRALLEKTNRLTTCDPRKAHKPLTGPLRGYYSIKVSRYRAIYTVREETLANGDTLLLVQVVVVAVGLRKAGDRRDVYALAERLIRFAGMEIEKPRRRRT